MRCCLIKSGFTRGTMLLEGGSDKDLIRQAEAIPREWSPDIEGVEVWRGNRCIYRSVELPSAAA